MSLTDFLFSGSPPPSVTTYNSTTPSLPPWFEAYQQGLLGKANVVAAEPYQKFTAPAPAAYDALREARFAPFTGDTQTGWGMGRTAANSWQPGMNAASDITMGAASGPTASEAAQPSIDAVTGLPRALNSAQPGLTRGMQEWPDRVSDYMNPFTDQVANRITELSNRNLFENVLPNINDNFVRQGMLGSTRHGDFTNRAVRDQGDSLLGALSSLYSGAYNTGAQQFGADASRSLQGASTAGNLANADRSSETSLASLRGNLANVDRTTAGTLGQDMAAIANQTQRAGITGAGVFEGIGNQQMGREQQLLDMMYNNFLEQREYPKTQTTFMNNMIRGLQTPAGQVQQTTGPATTYQAAPFAQLLGAGLGLASLFNNKAEGGRIQTYRDGGHVEGEADDDLARQRLRARYGELTRLKAREPNNWIVQPTHREKNWRGPPGDWDYYGAADDPTVPRVSPLIYITRQSGGPVRFARGGWLSRSGAAPAMPRPMRRPPLPTDGPLLGMLAAS
jgi:hypothetical protein